MLSFGRHIQNLSAKAASSLHALKCAASIKFLPIADWIHCTRSWNFRVIDLAIWKCCLEFLLSLLLSIPCTYAFQLLLFIHSELSLHLSLQFLISVSIFSFCSLFFDCCKSLVRYPFLFLLRLDAYNRFCGYFQQDYLGTFPEIFLGYIILCSLQCRKPVGHLCCKLYCFLFLEFLKIQSQNAVLSLFISQPDF